MDLFDVARSCFRRWYVFLPLLLLTLWFSHGLYTAAKPVYYSNAVISVAPPSTRVDQVAPGAEVRRNGLLDVGGATLITNMAALGLRDPAVVARVVAAGGEPYYSAKMFPVAGNMMQLPLIMIEVTAPDADAASKTVDMVASQADSTLRTLQQDAGVPDDQMVKPFVVSPPSKPAAGMPSRMRSTIATFIAGAGLSVLTTLLVDVFLTRRKIRAQTHRQEEEEAEAAARTDTSQAPTDIDGQEKHDPIDEVAMDSR